MVKNMSGGSKTKSFARKLQHEVPSGGIRMPANEFEVIGCVFRMLGNGRMVVRTAHSSLAEVQCVIRNKFRGRAKRNHMVSVGSFVLIGLYDWEAPNFKTSDMLHMYSLEDVSALKTNPLWSTLLTSLDSFLLNMGPVGQDQDFIFSTEDSVEIQRKDGKEDKTECGDDGGGGGDGSSISQYSDINFDDI